MSTNPNPPQWNARISEETARRLLARAIEIDTRRSAETSLMDLWYIAEEAGISRAAFEMALREIAEKERAGTLVVDASANGSASSGWFRRLATPLNAAVLAVALFAIAAAASLTIARRAREPAAASAVDVEVRAGPQADFQRDTALSAP